MGVTASIQPELSIRRLQCYNPRQAMHPVWGSGVCRERRELRRLVFGISSLILRAQLIINCSLYLNVWAPKNATKSSNLPVKIWIHGGGEQGGGIQNPIYDGCNLAAQDTVLVSLSYRLGPLGFLTLSSAGIDGNFGVQDILLGLDWVQSHISAFGGDKVSYLKLCFRTRVCR
jgi:hypothetical protein